MSSTSDNLSLQEQNEDLRRQLERLTTENMEFRRSMQQSMNKIGVLEIQTRSLKTQNEEQEKKIKKLAKYSSQHDSKLEEHRKSIAEAKAFIDTPILDHIDKQIAEIPMPPMPPAAIAPLRSALSTRTG